MAEITRLEIRVRAVDDQGGTSDFLHWAESGPRNNVRLDGDQQFDRAVAAMQGQDVGIFADHFQSVELLDDNVLQRRAERQGETVVETVTVR